MSTESNPATENWKLRNSPIKNAFTILPNT